MNLAIGLASLIIAYAFCLLFSDTADLRKRLAVLEGEEPEIDDEGPTGDRYL
jgi:hypothetical protein